ncbi:Uncharacterised protein [Mycobacteroides abscessus subsp. abscessus]|nr:Uncharacterised protein [Mycobacteroides abscessus subsp. abscessus]
MQRFVSNRDTVMRLITRTQALQNLFSFFFSWFVDLNRRKPPLQSSIFFNILLIFI